MEAGDVLARLGDREQVEAAVAGAELELASVQLKKSLPKPDLLAAQQALQAINENWPQQATLAQQALKHAVIRQDDADRNLNSSPPPPTKPILILPTQRWSWPKMP